MNDYHDQWEPPRGGWGLLLVLIIAFWAGVYFIYDCVRDYFSK